MLKTVSSTANAIGALNYKGTWNASTNAPTLASGAGTKGDYYVVSVAGTTLIDGISLWGVGDWIAFNGTAWQRVDGGANGEFVDMQVTGTSTFGGASTTARVNIRSATSNSGSTALVVETSAGSTLFSVRGDGLMYCGTSGASPWNNAVATAANMVVTSSGELQRSTSSLKYKKNVQDAVHGLAEVLQLRPVTYQGKSDRDTGQVIGGLVAEQVHEAGLTEFVQYAEDGTPDALFYANMVSLAFKAIQEQQTQIETLKAEVATLKGV
jgi:hypothetical protein